MGGAIIMAIIGLVCLIGGAGLGFAPTVGEAATYRRRIAATMLAAAGIILVVYAGFLWAWSHGAA